MLGKWKTQDKYERIELNKFQKNEHHNLLSKGQNVNYSRIEIYFKLVK